MVEPDYGNQFEVEGRIAPKGDIYGKGENDEVDGCAGRPAEGRRWKSVAVKA
jgi:hypothetical protein